MAFKLGDMIFKEILYGYAEDRSNKTPLYLLTQLSQASIEITAESSDVTDKMGNLVKKVWKSKSGSFSATNAFCNGNILAMSSDEKISDIFASNSKKVTIPKIKILTPGETVVIGNSKEDANSGAGITYHVSGKVTSEAKVNSYFEDGSLGKSVVHATTVSSDEATTKCLFNVDPTTGVATVTAPSNKAGDGSSKYILRYFVEYSKDAAKITNSADKFPSSVRLYLFASYYDPCTKNKLKTAVIELPSFQVSPETSISINADEPTMDFNGDLEIDYCSTDKALYHIYLDVDEEDEI